MDAPESVYRVEFATMGAFYFISPVNPILRDEASQSAEFKLTKAQGLSQLPQGTPFGKALPSLDTTDVSCV